MGNICTSTEEAPTYLPKMIKITGSDVSTHGFVTTHSGELFCDGVSVENLRQT